MAYQLHDHGRCVELRLYDVVLGIELPPEPWYDRVVRVGRLLVDASGVTEVCADTLWLAAFVRSVQSRGSFRTAVVAPSPLVFGTFRQVLAYRGELPHDAPVQFFQSREDALAWLLGPAA